MNTTTVDPPRMPAEPVPAVRRARRREPRAAIQVKALDVELTSRRKTADHPGRGDLVLYLIVTLLVGVAWQISRMQLFKANDNTSYWIAVTGGVMMLMLFSYPLRKYLRFMQGLGKVRWWFMVHLFLGIAGPWMILVHSTFRIGSLNAGVALFSMIIVVLSGVVGRFIHVRVHRGLSGKQMSLQELRERAGLVESDARSRLHFSPIVEERLQAFEQHELEARPGWLTHLRRVTLLPVVQQLTYLSCAAQLRRSLKGLAVEQHWSPGDLQRRERKARRLVDRYLDAVVRVAQYTAYERLFSFWHIAHLPFVYLLIISALVHVVAVHAY